ncbi:MAG TPA: regulatory protein RecX [Chitinophagaceae bacterium]|nr:regulatory protein RecX [Chitinophagaceae bacterium]
MQKRFLTKQQALQKLRHYCGYQGRSHQDAVQKLWELRVSKKDHDEIISLLIKKGYLNEERFAIQFAGGKFRINGWGRKKILHALKEKQVSSYNITKALKCIDEADYQKKMQMLAQKKYLSLKNEQYLARKKKTMDYLLQKGYEQTLISRVLVQIEK